MKELTIYAEQYAEVCADMKRLEERKKELAKTILDGMTDTDLARIELKDGSITKMSKKTYAYSENVTSLTEILNSYKKVEEEKGIAEQKETIYIQFNKSKAKK